MSFCIDGIPAFERGSAWTSGMCEASVTGFFSDQDRNHAYSKKKECVVDGRLKSGTEAYI